MNFIHCIWTLFEIFPYVFVSICFVLPIYVSLQEPAPVTEDMLEEQAEVLVQLGTHAEGAALRARMQSACLMSDMEAFKVNQNSTFLFTA